MPTPKGIQRDENGRNRNCITEAVSRWSVDINLAGSVNPDIEDTENMPSDKKEDLPTLEAHPDIRIRLTKPSGKSVIFNCSLPSRDTQQQLSAEGDQNLPTYSVDSVEMEGVSGYFVYTDLFDDNMYDHTMQLLMERKLDANFQDELQDYCTAEEHKLYLKFLDEFHAYCRE
ncbi:Complement component 1 Q subcomponent-binding protein mitochondrial [Fasciola hepatica]|uniref:Complement component 1 Q subcomponent-binding protein mitochondrial n=1 Tax=Fasciola hepatica TaxID=6192 RepID=A0A4E0RFC0_FASHE|nr:Complement component 1 Q subcomponent-binding protein mitochondrial [Fasciola hepatica]